MTAITPSFVIKTRRADRSIVYINICMCSDVPINTEPLPEPVITTSTHSSEHHAPPAVSHNLIYMVGGPIKDIPVSPEEQAFLTKEQIHFNSIYDVAVNPAVIQEAHKDQQKKELVRLIMLVLIV